MKGVKFFRVPLPLGRDYARMNMIDTMQKHINACKKGQLLLIKFPGHVFSVRRMPDYSYEINYNNNYYNSLDDLVNLLMDVRRDCKHEPTFEISPATYKLKLLN